MRVTAFFLSVFTLGFVVLAEAQDHRFEALGVAAPVSRARAFYAMNGEDGSRFVLMWLRDVERNSVLLVDAADGESTVVELPARPDDSPYATLLHDERILYAVTGRRFWGFDTGTRKWVLDAKVGDKEAMVFAKGPDGLVYAATYPGGHLMTVDPEKGEVTDFGAINSEEWPQYPREMAVGPDGWVYVGIGNVASQVAAFHPETGEKRALAQGKERARGRGFVYSGTDGEVYGKLRPGGDWHRFSGGKAIPVAKVPAKKTFSWRAGTQEDVFPEFPEGGRVTDFSVADRWFEVADREGGKARRVTFEYESAGANIFPLLAGPDGKIYGSTGHPLRFFRFDPETRKSESWGFDGSNGHINVLARDGDSIYGGIYVGGILVRYDLNKSIEHTRHGKNPVVLARANSVVMRPNAMAVHPNGREIVMTGGGGYGATGGGMMIYDLREKKAEILTHEQVIPMHSTNAFVFTEEGDLIGGTSTSPGTGGVRKATEAVVYRMDWETRKVRYQIVPVPGEKAVLDVKIGSDGLVYGLTSGGKFFAFDPETREIAGVADASEYGRTTGGQSPRVLHLDRKGNLYALFRGAIVRVELVDAKGGIGHEKIADTPAAVTTGGVVAGDWLYFTSNSELWRFDLREGIAR